MKRHASCDALTAVILVIETAADVCSVALFDGDRMVDSQQEVVGRGHAERLLPMVADLLGQLVPDRIAADCGPGSFTGVRVGLAAARALGLAWNVPVVGFSSLSLIAAGAVANAGAVAIPGGHGELFVSPFAGTPRRLTADPQSLPPQAAAGAISDEVVVGAGAASLIRARGWGCAREGFADLVHWGCLDPRDRELAPTPIYVRAPDARPMTAA